MTSDAIPTEPAGIRQTSPVGSRLAQALAAVTVLIPVWCAVTFATAPFLMGGGNPTRTALLLPLIPAVWLAALVGRWRKAYAQLGGRVSLPSVLLQLAICAVFVREGIAAIGSLASIARDDHVVARLLIDVQEKGPVLEALHEVGSLLVFESPPADMDPAWMPCDGRVLSKSEFRRLHEALPATRPSEAGGNTFRLPDYRGMTMRMPEDRPDAEMSPMIRELHLGVAGAPTPKVGVVPVALLWYVKVR